MSGRVENFNAAILMNVKLCMIVLEFHLSVHTTFSELDQRPYIQHCIKVFALTIFQDHTSVKQSQQQRKILCTDPIKLELVSDCVLNRLLDHEYYMPLFLCLFVCLHAFKGDNFRFTLFAKSLNVGFFSSVA